MSSGTARPAWATPTRLVVLSFASIIAVGTVLLMLPWSTGARISPKLVDAAFTATSAVCVTGLVVVNTASYWSVWGQIIILGLIQMGGLGLMTFATMHALFTGRRIGLRERLLIQEQTGQSRFAGLVRLMRRIIIATLAFELTGAVILGAAIGRARHLGLLESAFQGLFHAVSAFCNAGFDILGDSLMSFQASPVVIITIGALIIFGGIGFHVLVDLWVNRGKWSALSLHTKLVLKVTATLILAGMLAVLALEWDNPGTLGPMSMGVKTLSAWFQSVTPRTAGFNSILQENMLVPTAFLMIVLMFIGASPGGTGGGVKTTTFAVATKFVLSTIKGEQDVTLGKRRMAWDAVTKAVAIIMLSLSLVALATFILAGTEKVLFLDALFEVTSAFGTVGLSRGITPSLTSAGKIVLMITMFAGRVGPLSLAIALSRQKSNGAVRYPEERVSVG